MSKNNKIVIIGAGEFAQIAYEYFTYDSDYKVVAFSVEKQYIESDYLFGLPVVPFEDLEKVYTPQIYSAYVAVTYTELNRVRARLYLKAKGKGYSFASYVSSKAFVWRNVMIGENSFIFENNVIQYHVKIGNNVILWSGNHIGHRTEIEDNCYVSSHVVISGYCKIGKNCFLGVNSCFNDKISVAEDCIIGSGTVVTRDTERGKVYIGNPAKPLAKASYKTFNVEDK